MKKQLIALKQSIARIKNSRMGLFGLLVVAAFVLLIGYLVLLVFCGGGK